MGKIRITREDCDLNPTRYELTFLDDEVDVVVTDRSKHLQRWINGIVDDKYYYRCNPCGDNVHPQIIGLSVELRPYLNAGNYKPVAILQLCVGRHCLIFNFHKHLPFGVPQVLEEFLQDQKFTFVGVGIRDIGASLKRNYNLEVSNIVDLCELASERLGKQELLNVGLRELAKEVLNVEYEKPNEIALSKWDSNSLSEAQVQHASIDAFLCFKIGLSFDDAKIVLELPKTVPNVVSNDICEASGS